MNTDGIVLRNVTQYHKAYMFQLVFRIFVVHYKWMNSRLSGIGPSVLPDRVLDNK